MVINCSDDFLKHFSVHAFLNHTSIQTNSLKGVMLQNGISKFLVSMLRTFKLFDTSSSLAIIIISLSIIMK